MLIVLIAAKDNDMGGFKRRAAFDDGDLFRTYISIMSDAMILCFFN